MFSWLLAIICAIWDFLAPYPTVTIEQIGKPEISDDEHEPHFDYIIVGGGTAGCVLANRLSEDPSIKVLLLERGTVREQFLSGCLLASCPVFNRYCQREISLAPQPHLVERKFRTYEGVGLGGRSRINGALYLHGCPQEYEKWGEGWQWDDVAPSFARLERRQDDINSSAEWTTQVTKPLFECSRRFAKTMEKLGVPTLGAYSDPETPTCFGIFARKTLDSFGRRLSTYHAFLPKSLVRRRKNLTICLGATVQRILFSEKLRATGLLVETNHKRFTVPAKEIVLSAGPIATPQLLLLSGVGPRDHLEALGKTCKHDLPGVGSSLQDHLFIPIRFAVPLKDSFHRLLANPFLFVLAFFEYLLFGTGVFITQVLEYFCFLHLPRFPPNHDPYTRDLPDIEFMWTPAYADATIVNSPPGKGCGSIMMQTCTPRSIGTVRLSPNGRDDIKVNPIVDPNYLSHPSDMEICRRGVLFGCQVGKEMEEDYPVEPLNGPKSNAPEDIDAYIRETALSGQHLLCSCPMRPLNEMGVVDQELKVYGIKGLRIADGSVVPSMIASRPQATVAMIGDRCAEIIRRKRK